MILSKLGDGISNGHNFEYVVLFEMFVGEDITYFQIYIAYY